MACFWSKTMEPEIFWTALSAVATVFAVIVALFLPVYSEWKRSRSILTLVAKELSVVMDWIETSQQEFEGLPEELASRTADKEKFKLNVKLEALKKIDTELWQSHKHELSVRNPERYIELTKLYGSVMTIVDTAKNPEQLRLALLDYEINCFQNEYLKVFKKAKRVVRKEPK